MKWTGCCAARQWTENISAAVSKKIENNIGRHVSGVAKANRQGEDTAQYILQSV